MPLVGAFTEGSEPSVVGIEVLGISSDSTGSASSDLATGFWSENLKVLDLSLARSSAVQPLTGQKRSMSQDRGRTCLDQLLLKNRSRAKLLACSCWAPD